MKTTFIQLILIFFSIVSYSQTIENAVAQLQDDKVIITYDIVGYPTKYAEYVKYDVFVYSSLNLSTALTRVSGAIGPGVNVNQGTGLKTEIDVSEFRGFKGQLSFELHAELQTKKKYLGSLPPKYWRSSAVVKNLFLSNEIRIRLPVFPTNSITVDFSLTPFTAILGAEDDKSVGEKRFALVIGNSDYQYISKLKNPANDAADFAAELQRSNFQVFRLINGTKPEMRKAILQFQEKLVNGPPNNTVGLFYYAGHGVQFEGENYVIPVEANVQYDDEISGICLGVQKSVLRIMENSNSRMNIVIMDACRNNPFPSAFRSGTQGLATMAGKGSFIAFATGPGSVASDGNSRNGLYTQELIKAIKVPGRQLEQIFKDVRANVQKLSGGSQNPWEFSNITGDFVFLHQ